MEHDINQLFQTIPNAVRKLNEIIIKYPRGDIERIIFIANVNRCPEKIHGIYVNGYTCCSDYVLSDDIREYLNAHKVNNVQKNSELSG